MVDVLLSLVIAAVLTAAFRVPLVRWPGACYAVAIIVVVAFLGGALPAGIERGMLPLLRRCTLPYGLFVIVMYIGVLPSGSRLRTCLKPVRGPLSIVASLLVLAHVGSYVQVYLGVALSGFVTAAAPTATSLIIACVLVILLAVLAVTSLQSVRRHMHGGSWKRLQRLAYPFFILVSVHASVLLFPSAATGSGSLLAISFYAGIALLYGVLRVGRWLSGRSSEPKASRAVTASSKL